MDISIPLFIIAMVFAVAGLVMTVTGVVVSVASVVIVHRILSSSNEFSLVREELEHNRKTLKDHSDTLEEIIEKIQRIENNDDEQQDPK